MGDIHVTSTMAYRMHAPVQIPMSAQVQQVKVLYASDHERALSKGESVKHGGGKTMSYYAMSHGG